MYAERHLHDGSRVLAGVLAAGRSGGFSGVFSVKMWGPPPWGKGGEKMMEMLTEVCTRVLFLSNNSVYA